MLTLWIVLGLAAVVAVVVVSVVWLVPADRRARERARRARESRVASARAQGWRLIDSGARDSPGLPDVVRSSMRADGVWLTARKSAHGADIWLVGTEIQRVGPGGSTPVHALTVHVRPKRPTAGAPDLRLVARNPVLRPFRGSGARTGDKAFDRRYRVVADDPTRAVVRVTDGVRAETLRQGLAGWLLQDGIFTVRFDGLREPDRLRHRTEGLCRMAWYLTDPAGDGRPAGDRRRTRRRERRVSGG